MEEKEEKIVEREASLYVHGQERSFGTYSDRNMNKRYSGFDYGFAAIEYAMRKTGVWPLQTNDLLFSNVCWSFVTLINLFIAVSMFPEMCMGCGDSSDLLESFLGLNTSIHAICNCLFPKIHRRKLAENVDSAIKDWSYPLNKRDEESRGIMTRYARASKLICMSQLTVGCIGCCVYFTSVQVVNVQQVDTAWNGTVKRQFVLPVNCFFDTVSNIEYRAILLFQLVQILALLITQWSVDAFFFSIVLHLCGQLRILKIRFSNFIDEGNSSTERFRKRFTKFVDRHCRLIDLADNLEDAFNLSVMIQLLMNAILLALTGFRLILSIKRHDNVEVVKSFLFIQFTIIQSLLYTCAADLLGGHSEDIFHALWQTSWNDLPTPMIRNLSFVMTRSKKPLRITAGKFLYVSRVTFLDILKAAVSYISFLRITI